MSARARSRCKTARRRVAVTVRGRRRTGGRQAGNSPAHYNDDGFKVNSSYNVTYTDGWISSNDDNITVAACCGNAALQSTYNVNISNLVVDGHSAGVPFAFINPGLTVRGWTVENTSYPPLVNFNLTGNSTNHQYPGRRFVGGVSYECSFCQGQGLKNWDIQVSADGVDNWTTVASSGDVSWNYFNGTREMKMLSFPTATAKGMRLLINNAYLDFSEYQVDQVAVFNTSSRPSQR